MKTIRIYLSLFLLIGTSGVKAGGSQYTEEYLNNACAYLGGFCEITKQKCLSEEALDQDECLVNYTIKAMHAQEIPQDPADLRNETYSKYACEKLGDECNSIKLECFAGGGLFNTCIAYSYFEIEVSKELCGVMSYKTCLDRDREFGVKVIRE